MFFDMMTMNPVSYRGSYESAANGDPNRENARIKVENTNANILLIAGTDDMMWQSDVEHIYENDLTIQKSLFTKEQDTYFTPIDTRK